jgi:hypothetical protein
VKREPTDQLMSRKEAADYVRRTPGALAQMAYLGRGPKYLRPTTKSVLYRRSDLDAWLDASLIDPSTR